MGLVGGLSGFFICLALRLGLGLLFGSQAGTLALLSLVLRLLLCLSNGLLLVAFRLLGGGLLAGFGGSGITGCLFLCSSCFALGPGNRFLRLALGALFRFPLQLGLALDSGCFGLLSGDALALSLLGGTNRFFLGAQLSLAALQVGDALGFGFRLGALFVLDPLAFDVSLAFLRAASMSPVCFFRSATSALPASSIAVFERATL